MVSYLHVSGQFGQTVLLSISNSDNFLPVYQVLRKKSGYINFFVIKARVTDDFLVV